jgi:arginase
VEGIAPLKGHNLTQFGLRSYDGGEEDILKTAGANLYYMEDVKARGLATCFEEAFNRIQAHTPYFGVSIDIDGFDPDLAPGTGMHEPDGLNPQDVIQILQRVGANPNFVGLEIAEINLLNDMDNKTVTIVRELLKAVVG